LTGQLGQFWSVTTSGGDIMVKAGSNPTAVATDGGWLIADGQTREFAVSAANEKIALIDG
jgi:formylmethanofuran dehydrogenase subunit C